MPKHFRATARTPLAVEQYEIAAKRDPENGNLLKELQLGIQQEQAVRQEVPMPTARTSNCKRSRR